MKKAYPIACAFAVAFLFAIQMMGSLVESVYMLDLLHSSLDYKALGVLFFFLPLLALPFFRKDPGVLSWVLFALLFTSRGLTPYLGTTLRCLSSGIGTGAALSLVFLLTRARARGASSQAIGPWASAGLALALGLSVLLRSIYCGLDYSLMTAGGWLGCALGLGLGLALSRLDWGAAEAEGSSGGPSSEGKASLAVPVAGLVLVLGLLFFSFSAPSVIARWTEGNYAAIVAIVAFLSAAWAVAAIAWPGFADRIPKPLALTWNALFALSLGATLLAQRVAFPRSLDSPPVVVGFPAWPQRLPLVLALVLFPVLFLDARIFVGRIRERGSASRGYASGLLAGCLVLVLLVFANIFTNVWGYIRPVSSIFRNTYWLSFFAFAALITLLLALTKEAGDARAAYPAGPRAIPWAWAAACAAIFVASAVAAIPAKRVEAPAKRDSITVMTFNTQQANDVYGERSYDRQLALIRKVSPDVLALQESDSARISLNNNDYLRYYAERLGYYSYFGPSPVAGTYGTAILSKYPLQNTRTAFMYSDKDETGVAEAEIDLGGWRITFYDVHPDSSDPAMLGFAKSLVERSRDKPYAVLLGDFNLRDYEEPYKLLNAAYANAWTSVYPTKIGADGVDMSGEDRIDHIFLSPSLGARNPTYLKPPASATDHAVHWAEIYRIRP
jgi:endonuclease/exonuclease/phosphatase family metal-dependent hydrolase